MRLSRVTNLNQNGHMCQSTSTRINGHLCGLCPYCLRWLTKLTKHRSFTVFTQETHGQQSTQSVVPPHTTYDTTTTMDVDTVDAAADRLIAIGSRLLSHNDIETHLAGAHEIMDCLYALFSSVDFDSSCAGKKAQQLLSVLKACRMLHPEAADRVFFVSLSHTRIRFTFCPVCLGQYIETLLSGSEARKEMIHAASSVLGGCATPLCMSLYLSSICVLCSFIHTHTCVCVY